MLSAEELRLWDHVSSTQLDQPRAANQHLGRTRPLLEDDLVAAVAALKESTAAVEKQTNSLQRHTEYLRLDTFKCQPRGCERATRHRIDPIGRKEALEFQQLSFAVGEEIGAFTSSFNSASADALQIRKTTERRLAQRLHQDDQELGALQQLALPPGAVADAATDSDRTALSLVKRLVDFACEEIQCRLDRVYLAQLHAPLEREDGVGEGWREQEVPLKSDLDALYAEIRDVVTMSFSQEFEYPLLRSRQEDRQHQCASEELANQSILRTLSGSRHVLEEAVTALESFSSYRTSLDAIYAIYQKIVATAELTTSHDSLVSPLSQAPPSKEVASRALLRHIGISNESFTSRGSLEHDLSNKVTKLRAPSFFTASSANEPVRNILDTNSTSSQLLAHSSVGHLETSNAVSVDTSLGILDDKICLLKGKVEDIDLSNVVPSGTTQKHFLGTWAASDSC